MTYRVPVFALLLGIIASSAHAQQSSTADIAASEQEKADAHKAAADAGRAALKKYGQGIQDIDAAGKSAIARAPIGKGVAVIDVGCGAVASVAGAVGAACTGYNAGRKVGEAGKAAFEGDYAKAGTAALGALGTGPASEVLSNVGEGAIAVRDMANGEHGTVQTVVDTQANLANAARGVAEAMGEKSEKLGAVVDTVKAAADLPNALRKTDENVEQTRETLKAVDDRAAGTEASIQNQIDQEDSKAAEHQQRADFYKSGGPLRNEASGNNKKNNDFVATDPSAMQDGIKPVMEQNPQDTSGALQGASSTARIEPGHFSTVDGSITPPALAASPTEQPAIDATTGKGGSDPDNPNFVGPPAPTDRSADEQKVEDFVNSDLSEVQSGIRPVMEQQIQETSAQVSQSGISESSSEAASERESTQSEDNDSAVAEGQKTYSSLNRAMYGGGGGVRGTVSASKSTTGAAGSAATDLYCPGKICH